MALPLFLSAGTVALACSLVPGHKVPTNMELATTADVIVVATVEDAREGAHFRDNMVLARPTLLVKGDVLPAMVELPGAILGPTDEPPETSDPAVLRAWRDEHGGWPARRSDPRELRQPNPDALTGGCVRYVFTKGMKLVVFLKRDETGKLVPYRSPFSRDAEDVPSEDALWVRAVREYAAIGALPKDERKAALRARSEALAAMAGDPDAQAIARDMQIELKGKRLPPFD